MKSNKNFRKDDLSPESNTKKIYKMYKSKKQWVVAPVVFGLLLNALSPVAALAVTDTEQADVETAQARTVTPELQALIDQAVKNVNALEFLSAQDKTTHIVAINAAADQDALKIAILDAYRADIATKIDTVKKEFNESLDGLTSLSKEENAEQKATIKSKLEIALGLDELKGAFNEITDSGEYSGFKTAFDTNLAKNTKKAQDVIAKAVALDQQLADFPKYQNEQKAIIAALSWLTEMAKQDYYKLIDGVTSPAAVDELVEAAKNDQQILVSEAVTAKVAELKAETAKLESKNETKRDELNEQIDDVASLEDELAAYNKLVALTPEVNKAIDDALANYDKAYLKTEKEILKTTITNSKTGNSLITDADIKSFTAKVNSATTIEAFNAVKKEWEDFFALTNLKGLELEAAKVAGEELIGQLLNGLNEIQRTNYKRDIGLALSPEAIAAIVVEAQAANKKAAEQKLTELKIAKEQAIKEISALANLTAAEKEEKITDVDGATDVASINETVKVAKTDDATRALTKARNSAKAKVNGLEYLSDPQKTTAKEAIDDADDLAAVTKALNDAIYADYQAGVENGDVTLAEAKAIAKAAVKNLENLTVAQRDAANKDITDATTNEAITAVLTKAKEFDQANATANGDAKNLETKKAETKAKIDALTFLTKEMKDGYKAEITNAKNPDAVEEVFTKADTKNTALKNEQTDFENAKEDLTGTINASNHLTAADKKALISETLNCKTKAEVETLEEKVNQLIKDREIENIEDIEALKTKINETIGGLTGLSPAQKTNYTNLVNTKTEKADMIKVYNEAKVESDRILDKKITNKLDELIGSGSYVEAQVEINKLKTDSLRKEYQNKLKESIALTDAKAAANKQIDALENLSAEEKVTAKAKVASLKSKAAIDSYVKELVKADNLAHDKVFIELAEAQIKSKDFDKAAKTIEEIRDAETKAKLQKQLENAQKVVVAPTFSGSAHVSNRGWLAPVGENKVIGTTGKSLQMEAVKLNLSDVEMPKSAKAVAGGIEYRAHVKNIGWQKFVSNGALAGTVGEVRQMEAIQIKLTGELAKKYDVQYRVHGRNYGWKQGYVSNGATAGTVGKALRMEALQVRLVEKK